MKTLIVEDDQATLLLLRAVFESYASQLDEVHSLRECLSVITERKYEIIVLDLKLPDSMEPMHTVQHIPEIKKQQQGSPILVVSAHAGEGVKRASWAKGADYFIEKSSPDAVRANIIAVIAAITKGATLQENVELLKQISKKTSQALTITPNPQEGDK